LLNGLPFDFGGKRVPGARERKPGAIWRFIGDRHRRAALAPHNFHASVELLGGRRDNDRTQSGTWLIRVQLAFRGSNPVVGNHKSPTRFSRLLGNDNQASGRVADERMLERIGD
jgi:hypothetical protein